ncbi:MAG: PRC-barrel domain-containing protein [Clostridia bacterium]|jgi:uncharacterized protein YrrD|nr:hypothetical protein [Clostridiaceae bacterium]
MNETLQLVNYKDILGKRAYFAKEDRFAGSVKDIMFLLDEKKAVALLLERGLLPLVKPAVLFTDIQDIKNDRILIKSGSSMMSVKELKKSYNDCTLGNYLGKKVCSKTGKEYGRVYDIIINLYTGAVEAIEASDGLIQDAYNGRKLIPFMDRVEFAEEMVILDKVSEEEMLTGGGLRESKN